MPESMQACGSNDSKKPQILIIFTPDSLIVTNSWRLPSSQPGRVETEDSEACVGLAEIRKMSQ